MWEEYHGIVVLSSPSLTPMAVSPPLSGAGLSPAAMGRAVDTVRIAVFPFARSPILAPRIGRGCGSPHGPRRMPERIRHRGCRFR